MPKKIYINKSNYDEDDEKKKSSGGYASQYVARRNNTPSNVSSGGYASRYVASKTSTRDYSQRQDTPDVRDAWAHQQANNGLFGSAYAAARREAAERAERERENRYYSSVIPGYNVLNEQGQAEAREKLTVDRPSSLNMTRAAFAKASQENQEKKAYDGMNGLQRTGEAAKSILKGVEKQYFGNQWSGISNAVDAVAGAMNGGATKSRENQVSAWAPYREAVKSASWDYVNQLLNGQQDAVENSGKALDRAVNNDWYLADAYDDKYGTNTARPKVREQLKSIADRIAAGDTSITADNILDYLEFGSLEDQVNEVFDRDDAIYSQFNDIIQSGQRDIDYAKAVGPIQGKFGDLTVDALAAALSSLQSSIMNRFSLGGVMASMAGDATGAVVGKLADKFGNTSALAKGAGFVGNRITDILGMSEFGVQSYGASTNEARQKMLSQGLEIGEKEFDQIQKYGAAKTAVELGTEMLFSSVGAIRNASGKGSVSEMFDAPGIGERLGDAISKLSKTERGAQILGLIGEKLGGGVEEGLEEVIGRLVDDVFDIGGIIGEDEQKSTFREYLTDFAVGMMSGLAGDAMRFVVDNVAGANEDNSDYAGNANRLRDFLNSDMSERAMDEAYADSIGRQMEAGTYDVENDPIWRAAYDRLETEQQIRREGIVSDADRRAQELLGAADFTQNDGSVSLESTQNRGEENGREAYYDNGTERYDSYDSGVEAQRMAEEPGFADRGASAETAQQFRGAEQAPAQRLQARTGQVKSTELLGTKVGVADNTVTIIDTKAENTPAVVRRIEKLSSYLGRDIGTTHYYSGTLYRKGFNDELYEVHGFVDPSTGDVYIGVDDPQRAEKTFRHEVTHLLVAANKISVRKVMDYMKSMDPKAYSDIMTVYASAYAGSGMSLEGIWGEAVADAMAGINIEAREGSMFWNALEEYMPMVRHAVEDIHTITGDVFTEAYHTETDTSQNGTNAPPIYKDILASLGKNAKAQYTKNGDLVIAENADQSTVLYSNRTLSKTQSALAKILFEKGYSDADVKRALNIVSDQAAMLNDIFRETEYSYLGDALDADVHTDIRGRQVLRAIVKNGEYPVNIDFLTICKKRQAYSSLLSKLLNEGIFDQIQFDADAIAMVNEELRNAGFETACLMCFVESRRQQIQKWATTFRDDWNAAVDKALDGKKAGDWNFYKGKRGEYRLTNNEALALSDQFEKASAKLGKNDKENLKLGQGSVPVKMATLLKNMPSLAKHLSTADLLTPEGFENLSRVSPELRSLLLQHYGSNTPKPVQEFTPYNGEIGDLSGNFMAKVVGESIPGLGQLQDAAKKIISAEAMAAFEEQAKLALSRKADALLDQIEEKRDTDDVDELWKEYKKVNPTKANIKREVNNLVNQWSAEEAIQKYLFDIGGVRLQSFSDYLVENTLDYYQLFADLAAKEFPLHAYTKEITFARLFGMTGAKINLSLIARLNLQSENAGLNPDGTYAGWSDYYNHAVLHPDEYIQSVGYKDAVALMMDPRYSSNVGTIAIGVSPAQIRKMLSDPYIRMVIPYHASGMNPTFAQLMHIDRYRDSTQYQNTSYGQMYDLDGNPVDTLTVGSKEMSGAQLRGTIEKFLWDETLQRVGDPKKAADEYLAWCARRHDIIVDGKVIGQGVYKPMFSGDYAHAENDFTNEENYYKLLENFTTKDAITEENAPQKAVQMLYPNQENVLSGKDLSDYEARLREAKTDTGEKLFSEKDIAKYVKWAQQSSEDIIRAEVKSRKEYHDVQDAKLESETYPKIKARLQSGDFRFSTEGQQLTDEEQKKALDSIDDNAYMSAVESGDMKTAQRMVDEAARQNGYTEKVYHGTPTGGFTKFDTSIKNFGKAFGNGIYFTDSEEVAQNFTSRSRNLEGDTNPMVYGGYLNLGKNPLVIDMDQLRKENGKKPSLIQYLVGEEVKAKGADASAIVIKGIYDGSDQKSTVYVAKESGQFKSADPVTYDEDGNVIPLSERFNQENDDIRYSTEGRGLSDAEQGKALGVKTSSEVDSNNRQLSEAQQEYFKNSKIRDSKGRLLPMYHGTDASFTVFNFDRGGEHGNAEGFGIYLTNDKATAESYGGRIIESYADITRPARSDKKTITFSEMKKLVKAASIYDAQRMMETDDGYTLSDALKDSWISNYTYTYDKSMDAAYAEVARDILRMNDNDMDIVQEVIAGMGIRNYAAALPFYDLLTETTGIDGFVTNWKHTDGSPSSMIALAFRSEQIKNIDNLNPTSDPDIRYSTEGRGLSDEEQARAIMEGTGSTEEIRSLVYDIKDAVATPKMQKPFDWAEHEAARLSKRLIDQYKKYLKSENVKTARGAVKINDLAPNLQKYVGWMQKQLTDKNNQDRLQTRQGQEEFAKEAKDRASVIASKLINAKTVLTETEQAKADTIAEAKRVLKARADIDEAYYKKLQNQFGTEFFPDEKDAKAMFDNVRDAVITLSPIYENPYQYYGWDMVEAVDRVAQDIVTQSMSDMASKAVPDALGNEIRNQAEEVRRVAERTVSSAKAAARMRRDKMIRDIQRHAQETQQARRDMREASEERSRLLRIARRLNSKKLSAENRARLNELIGDLDLIAQKLTQKSRMNLTELKEWYDDQAKNNPDFIADPTIQKKLDRLSKRQIGTAQDAEKARREGGLGFNGMSQDEVRDLTEALLNMENELAWGKKLIDDQDKREVYYIGKEIIDHVENAVGLHGYFKQRLHRAMVQGALEPYAMIHRVTGYNENDGLYRAEQRLEEGQRIGLDFTRRAYEIFDQAIADEKFMRKFYGQHADEIEISGLNAAGETVKVKITPDQRAALYMHSLNDQNLRHIMNGGLTVPDIEAYKAGRMDYAFDNSTLIRLTPSMVREITSHMTEGERRFCRMAREYYDEMSQKEINAVSLKLKGYELAKVEHYFPINTDRNFRQASYENLTQDGTIEGMGFLKERVEASNAIYLRGIVDVTKQSIRMTAKYVGLAIPVRNFSKLLSVNTGVYETQETYNGEKTVRHPDGSVMYAIAHTWGDGALKYIDKMMTDIQNPRHDEGPLVSELRKWRGLYAGGVLNMNLGVAVKQAASYPTAAAVLGWKPLFDAFRRSKSDRVDLDLVAKYTPLLWYRSRGFSSMELGDLAANEGFKLPKALNWIQAVDVMTTKKLWRASEAYVRDNYKDLEIRSDAYYKAVADVYNKVIERTQPNYTTMQRPEFLRSSFFVTSLFMFKTQPFQNFNIAYDAIGNLAAKQRMAKARGFDQQGMKDLKAARTQFRNGVTSLFVAAAVFSSMAGLWAAGRKKYGDDDPDMWWQDLISNFVSALIGGIPGATPIWEALSANLIFDDRYYGYETVTEGQFNDLLTNFYNVVKDLGDGKGITKKRAKQIAQTVGPFLGIPASNLINVWNAISAWTEGAIPEF